MKYILKHLTKELYWSLWGSGRGIGEWVTKKEMASIYNQKEVDKTPNPSGGIWEELK